jgi:hypothetical protein
MMQQVVASELSVAGIRGLRVASAGNGVKGIVMYAVPQFQKKYLNG